MNPQTWSIIDGFANELNSHEPDKGRDELKQCIANLQSVSTDLLILWRKAKYCTALLAAFALGLSIVSIIHTLQSSSPGANSDNIFIGIACGAFVLMFLVWYAPDIAQMLPIDWDNKWPFKDPALERPKAYLKEQAKLTEELFTQDGKFAQRAILSSPWGLFFLTFNDELYALPIAFNAKKALLRYPAGLALNRPATPLIATARPNVTNLSVYVDQRSYLHLNVNLTDVHNHYQFVTSLRYEVEKSSKARANLKKSQDASPGKVRWPCKYGRDDYEIRLFIFQKDVLPTFDRIESHQIEKYVAAIDGARTHWDKHKRTTIDKLAEKLGKIIAKKTDGFSGLGQTHSVSWIKSVIGGTGEYRFIKEAFDSIEYDPEQIGPVQYRLL